MHFGFDAYPSIQRVTIFAVNGRERQHVIELGKMLTAS
jgi:hypothetical protein